MNLYNVAFKANGQNHTKLVFAYGEEWAWLYTTYIEIDRTGHIPFLEMIREVSLNVSYDLNNARGYVTGFKALDFLIMLNDQLSKLEYALRIAEESSE